YMHKARDLMRIAKDAGVGFQVENSAGLGRMADSLLNDSAKLDEVRDRALALIERNKGASRRCAEAIAEMVEG
ncbi:MAG: hypothetical protein Q7N50_12820, partial [Armatimonadota bacterium]|nr:hypothetical protein [Armatimonadota bacterium]